MLRGTQPLLRIASVGTVLLAGACSLLNREGPDVTCVDLANGAQNACADGIIATCVNGAVAYKVCDEKSACSAPWQTSGRYRCKETEPAPTLTGTPAPDDGSSEDDGDVSNDGDGGRPDSSSTPTVDASDSGNGPATCESCVQSKCSAQLASCLSDGSCHAVYQCLLACTDLTCGKLCVDTAAKASASYSIRSCVGGGGVGSGCTAQCPAWP